MAPTDAYPQHAVTAVIVAHDGAAWLPRLLAAVSAQTKQLQRVVAVDTGSRDRSGSVLTAALGPGAVFGMERATGYAAAVARAVQHPAASAQPAGSPPAGRGEPAQTEWLWLLHDDCEPAPDALEQLLRGAAEAPGAAVLGPKLRDWADRDVVTEAGVTIDTAGRRICAVEPGEVDQGQHDGDRDSLAVSSAGMLVRRDVWEQAGGFDPALALFGEDVDFCWRVHQAGLRVRVVTDAVVYHAGAAAAGRRPVSVGRRAAMLQRRGGLVALLGNLPAVPMAGALAGNLSLSMARALFYLLAKRPKAALDEAAAFAGVAFHPLALGRARKMRARGRQGAWTALRADLPPGRSLRRAGESAAAVLRRSGPGDEPAAAHASEDPDADISLLTDSGALQRVLTRPGVLTFGALLVIAVVAEHRVLLDGTLQGGALPPAFDGASSLWAQFFQAYHPFGAGSASPGPPWAGLLAVLATILLGKVWLAVDVLLLGCVPLAGLTAFLALRRVTTRPLIRVWAALSYGLLPVAAGAISAGRLGSAVAFILIPVIGLLAGRMCTGAGKTARRAAWATGFVVTIAAAFVPLLWPVSLAAAVVCALTLRRDAADRDRAVDLAIVAAAPLVLLAAWLVPALAHPARFLLEAGVQQPGLAASGVPARALLLLSPGGPGLPPYWASAALVAAALAALAVFARPGPVVGGWVVALLGFGAAVLASRVTVVPPGGSAMAAWPGAPLAVAAAGLLLAAAAAADSVLPGSRRPQARTGGRRRVPAAAAAVAMAVVACSAPAIAAGYWLAHGVAGPLHRAGGQVVPALASGSAAGSGRQLRTLVLASSGGHVSYLLLRGQSPPFSYPGVAQDQAAVAALDKAVAALVAPDGSQAADQTAALARFDVGFVLLRPPLDATLSATLDTVPGLTQVSMTPAFDLWRLTTLPARVSVVSASGAVSPVTSAQVPAAGGTLLLAEPAGGWRAAVNGHALKPVPAPGSSWAQAFALPAGGGTLTITRDALAHDALMIAEVLAFLVVAVLALPGMRTQAELAGPRRARPGGDGGGGDEAAGSRPSGGDDDDQPEQELVPAGAGQFAAAPAAPQRTSGRHGRPRAPGSADDEDARGTGHRAGHARPAAQAAWPAGQPASRFLQPPPAQAAGYENPYGPVAADRYPAGAGGPAPRSPWDSRYLPAAGRDVAPQPEPVPAAADGRVSWPGRDHGWPQDFPAPPEAGPGQPGRRRAGEDPAAGGDDDGQDRQW